MKILLDECITVKLKNYLKEYDVSTVAELNWHGIKNGQLLKKALESKIDILITIDKNLLYQQNIKNSEIIIVVFNVNNSSVFALQQQIPEFKNKINSFEKGKVYII
jgi:predicted nucleic acid-binding protein